MGKMVSTVLIKDTFSSTLCLNTSMRLTISCLYSLCNNPVPEREEFDNVNKACALITFSLSMA